MQAPIETSTYDQVKSMLQSGVYHISCKYHQIFHCNEEIVCLKIADSSDSKQKHTVYTLSDLKDFESKIILVRDNSSSAANGQNLDTKVSEGISLLEKLSSKEVEGFLNVRTW